MNDDVIEPSQHMLLFLTDTFDQIEKRAEGTSLDITEIYFWMYQFLGGQDDNE